ncbi:MAG: type II toxin-antitoxin system PemK/MazF family toxin [Acidimicrobiia bacterium]|nr:type II toxin-antitoxin system PemK/MazF family toxin [Acidimicrobiia bacterium]MYC58005.1 type II toxin-antitoxin system PemK/MazF family toxin [Acidimicrobiia bacterium]MYI31046.1 type II toxin-antitoxin system PemK/MazF family toxin [Acidimicrobiia bacterium]
MDIIAGGVYYVADDKLTLLPESKRTKHEERRPFVVISGQTQNNDSGWPLVLGCPISSSTTQRTRFCIKLFQGEANLSKKSWIRVPAIQPLSKGDLEDFLGTISKVAAENLMASILKYMDVGNFLIGGDEDGLALH